MTTIGADGRVKVWDCRNWKGCLRQWIVRTGRSHGHHGAQLDWSQKEMLAVGGSNFVHVSDNQRLPPRIHPLRHHRFPCPIQLHNLKQLLYDLFPIGTCSAFPILLRRVSQACLSTSMSFQRFSYWGVETHITTHQKVEILTRAEKTEGKERLGACSRNWSPAPSLSTLTCSGGFASQRRWTKVWFTGSSQEFNRLKATGKADETEIPDEDGENSH